MSKTIKVNRTTSTVHNRTTSTIHNRTTNRWG